MIVGESLKILTVKKFLLTSKKRQNLLDIFLNLPNMRPQANGLSFAEASGVFDKQKGFKSI
ncbi:MAG: hypothetical protein Q9M37_08685 [Desulfonauticus sp.]|nr:hypothetical protein [Desulfonauticus sp.]